jgi:hypothetical protein
MWVNSIVALSPSQFIVFDQEGNMFIFQKNLVPASLEQKLKLDLKGSFCIGEEVQSAAFGSLRMMSQSGIAGAGGEGTEDQEKSDKVMMQKKRKAYSGMSALKSGGSTTRS